MGGSRVGYLRFFCLHWITCLSITEDYFVPQSHKLNLTYRSKSSLLLAYCFLFVCMADQTQMCFSSISPLGPFQGIICNIERKKGGPWSPVLLGNLVGVGTWFERGGELRPLLISCDYVETIVANAWIASHNLHILQWYNCRTHNQSSILKKFLPW